VTHSIRDNESHLNLSAGTHTLKVSRRSGWSAPGTGVGDGSDLGRIQLQQGVPQGADGPDQRGAACMTSPTKLFKVADTATQGRHHRHRARLGDKRDRLSPSSLQKLNSSDVHMITLPVAYSPGDPNRVVGRNRLPGRHGWRRAGADNADRRRRHKDRPAPTRPPAA